MAHKRVNPVNAINPVSRIKAIDSGNTYFRQLDQWRVMSEVNAEARRAREFLFFLKKEAQKK